VCDITQAVIFAGGLGEKLKPFTETNPKPMYRFYGKPFLEYLIEQIKGWGIKDIILLLGYLPEKITEYFGDGSKCDFTNAPFEDNSIDFIYSLNVLEHIEDDKKTIAECYRILKSGGYCLFVVPRGDKLYDYFDEILFHKRRYAKGELRKKCENAGFKVKDNFHFAWLCYPAFWLKKKWNRHVGKGLTKEEKMERVKADIDHAMASPLAIRLMHLERALSDVTHPSFGVREIILCIKE
jgi:putative generic methyltransferase